MDEKPKVNIFWFRRDLRLHDNAGLFYALKSDFPVLPVFIFDTDILDFIENKHDARVEFIHGALQEIQEELIGLNSSLLFMHGKPTVVFKNLLDRYDIHSVFTNHDYEPYAIDRDEQVASLLILHGISFITFKDHVIFEKDEIIKENGESYTIYTSYNKKWKLKLDKEDLKLYQTKKLRQNFYKTKPFHSFELEEIGFKNSGIKFPSKKLNIEILENYDTNRNLPYFESTTRLGVHFRFGTISIRELVLEALKYSQSWLNELIWREFFTMILYHFPYVAERSFRQEFDNIKWRNNEEEFKLWCEGRTGYPLVDAGMRELKKTGFMHNRIRMITASFLTKHLLIDWRWGEVHFAANLLDYDLASNNGNWQWAAGTGCDAAPFFRIFNPFTQQEKFDPDFKYIKKWIPEFGTKNYPKPIVEHTFARNRAIGVYKACISKFKNLQ